MHAVTEHSLRSSYRESILEHLLMGALMRELWLSGVRGIEVLKPAVDDNGYDLVLEVEGIVRHVQLKSSFAGCQVCNVTVNRSLMKKPSGCIVLLRFNQSTLEFTEFLYFGGKPGQPLPSLSEFKPARNTRANSQGVKGIRPGVCCVPVSKFEHLESVKQLALKLFGSASADGPT